MEKEINAGYVITTGWPKFGICERQRDEALKLCDVEMQKRRAGIILGHYINDALTALRHMQSRAGC
jgi:hypothetical protein